MQNIVVVRSISLTFRSRFDFDYGIVHYGFVLLPCLLRLSLSCSSWTTVLHSIEETRCDSTPDRCSAADEDVEGLADSGGKTSLVRSKSLGIGEAGVAGKLSSLRSRKPLTPRTKSDRNIQAMTAVVGT